MPKRPGKAAMQRRQDAHRERVNAINSDRFEKITAYVSETGDIDMIRTYTRLLTEQNFDEIDRIIASFSNESFTLSVDIDNTIEDEFIHISDEVPIDIAYKNEGRAQIITDDPTPVVDIECGSEQQEPEECVTPQEIECKTPQDLSPDETSSITASSSSPSKTTTEQIEAHEVFGFSEACSEIVMYVPEPEVLYDWFLENRSLDAPHNTTFLYGEVKRVKHGVLLTNDVSFFNNQRGIRIAIVPKHFVLPNLLACFLLRTDKAYDAVFHLRMRWQPRAKKFDPRSAVDLSKLIDTSCAWKRRRLK